MGIPIRVLIVEDSTDDAELVLRQLRRAGYDPVAERVQTAEDMKAALERDAWDLVVTDYSMPQFDAPTALNLLNQSGRDVPFIVVSGSIGEDIAVTMMKTGAHDYVLKENLTRFVPAVQRELREAENRRQHRLTEQAKQRLQIERDEFLERLKQENEDLAALTQVTANAISTLDLDELLHALLGRMVEVMHADTATILLAEGAELRVRASAGVVDLSDSTDVVRVGEGFAGSVAAGKQPVYVEDAAVDPLVTDSLVRKRGIRSMLGVPLQRNGTLIGVLHVDWLTVRPCRDREVHLLEITAERCAAAIQNAQLYAEARQAEETLAQSEAFSRAVLNSLSYHIVVLDAQGTIVAANRAWQIFASENGGHQQTIHPIGTNYLAVVEHSIEQGDAIAQAGLDGIRAVLSGARETFALEYPCHSPDKQRWFVMRVQPRSDELGGAVVAHQDITDRVELEAQFRQAQKMESVGQLAGGIAHDFNNLLTVINGTAEFALTQVTEGDQLHEDLQEIRRAAERAAALTRQLLAFSRQQILQPQVLNLDTVVAEMEAMLRRLIGEDIGLVVASTQGLGNVKADPGQMEQVIVNLAVNARDAMPEGGKLTIEMQNVVIDEQYARQHSVAVKPGPYVMLAMSDTGAGMDEVTRGRIFEPFFTTKGPGKGTGLGLSTVYGIVKQSDGLIWVYSQVGQGTSFKIYLPQVAEVAGGKRRDRTDAPARGVETILVVEDVEGIRHLAKRILESAGYTVLTAAGGEEALRLLKRHKEPVHLMVTDVVMPGMSGRALATRFDRTHPGMKVLYMSGYTDDAIVRHGVLKEGVSFLGKPFTAADLIQKVREVLDSEVGLDLA